MSFSVVSVFPTPSGKTPKSSLQSALLLQYFKMVLTFSVSKLVKISDI